MKRALTGAVVAALLTMGTATAVAAPAAAALPAASTTAASTPAAGPAAKDGGRAGIQACTNYTAATVFGGYRARSICDGAYVDGFGTTANDAVNNRSNMQYLANQLGMRCATATLPGSVDGGYRIGWTCNNTAMQSLGTTLTTAGYNAYEFGSIAAQTATFCASAIVNRPTGGIRLQMTCKNRGVENYGTTLTDAAANVARLARIGGDTGFFCGYATLNGLSGGYRLSITCNFQWGTQGWGDNLTQMGQNVGNFVALGAYYPFRRCATVSVENVSSTQKRARAQCVPGGNYDGYGATPGTAAANAYTAAYFA